MIKLQTLEQAKPGRRYFRKDTFEGHITDLIATSQTRHPGEQAFLVEQDPNWVTPGALPRGTPVPGGDSRPWRHWPP